MGKTAMTRREKRDLIRILIALGMFAVIFAVDKAIGLDGVTGGEFGWLLPFGLYLAVYIVIGYDVLWKAVRNIAHGQVFDENFLMCVATLGAFALAIYRGATGLEIEGFDEACAVLLFYQVGEWFQRYATGKSRKSITALMDIRPDGANVLRGGDIVRVDPDDVEMGETIVVNPGERVALDGIVTLGASDLDTKALTGESLPRSVSAGDEIVSGSVNMTSRIEVRVTQKFHDSTVSKILELVENASSQKSKAENFITKFAKFYTPIVVGVALLLAIVPGAITGEWSTWIYRALSFLVVSCPCALVISIPLSFFAGLGGASKCGILIKGSNYLEKFNRVDTFVFDKTGTLTKGNFAVVEVSPEAARERILELAAIAENGSSHPIAASILSTYGKAPDGGYALTNVAGEGVAATRGDDVILCGNAALMARYGVEFDKADAVGTVVYVAHNGVYAGSLVIADEIKDESRDVVGALNAIGCKTVMLTGDNDGIAKRVAGDIGLTSYRASLLPQDKVSEVERLLSEECGGKALCFVGDGINDAPVLMRSDIGIAMGGAGSDAAIEASDIVLMKDDLRGIPLAKRIAEKTMRIVFENIAFSLAVKLAVLVLAAFGIANMWLAVFADVGVAVLAILNAMRALRVRNDRNISLRHAVQ